MRLSLRIPLVVAVFLPVVAVLAPAQTVINSDQTVALSGTQSAGTTTYDILGGYSQAVANGDRVGHANGLLEFRDSATAASATVTARRGETLFEDTISQDAPGGLLFRSPGGRIDFRNSSVAANATFTLEGGAGNGGHPANINFFDQSSAGAAVINLGPGELGPNFKNQVPIPVDGFGAEAFFAGNAKAGTAQITVAGSAHQGSNGWGWAAAMFEDSSSADHAVFINNGGTVYASNNFGGATKFGGTATAGFGTFTNNPGANGVTEGGGGFTGFYETSTAGNATFTNKAATAQFGGAGFTAFHDTANAGQATFINEGGAFSGNLQRGATKFRGNSSAADGMFTNKPGPGGGGAVEFYGTATAGNGTFVNDSTGAAPGSSGGIIVFNEQSTGGNGLFTTKGFYGGYIGFNDTSTAGQGTFTLEAGGVNCRMAFTEDSTAGSSHIEVGGLGFLIFQERATAGNATILVRSGTAGGNPVVGGGLASFHGGTAGNATIEAMGSAAGEHGGYLTFQSLGTTAGNATITLHGAAATTYGATAGGVRFDYDSDAGTATFLANGGTNGGQGGYLIFARGADGAQSRVVLNGNSTLDVAGNIYSGGTSFGSIEGAGSVILGGSLLSVGTLNTSTSISGPITDGGLGSNTGGQLTKVGTGTLTLAGTNTYSGLTTVEAGTLVVTGSLSGPALVKSGATLMGSGNIAGAVTAEAGAIVSPGTSPGTLTVGSLVLNSTSVLNFELGTTSDMIVVNGNLTLDGVLNIANAGGLISRDAIELFTWTGTLTDNGLTIGTVPAGFSASDFSFEFSGGKVVLKNSNFVPPPTINTPPTAASAIRGNSVQFSVAATGSGLTYQWQRQAAGSTTWSDLANGGAYAGATSATLTVTTSAALNGDQFRVIVTNGAGASAMSAAAALAVTAPPRLLNLSTRALAQTGDNVLIPGFVISGTVNKKLLIRAVGPTLGKPPFNVAGTLANPRMTLKKLNDTVSPVRYDDVASNDDWATNPNAAAITQTASDLYAFAFNDDRESALLLDLAPGQYTVVADGVSAATGVAIVELYDADNANVDAQLINISNRGFCGAGDQVMIPGFVVSSEGPKTLLIRVVGPTLGGTFNLPGTLADPKLELHRTEANGSSTLLAAQDNWGEDANAAATASVAGQVFAFPLIAGSKDAAFVVTLQPGVYTVVGSSAATGGTGVVLVEVYVVP